MCPFLTFHFDSRCRDETGCHERSPDDGLCVVRDHGAREEELWAQQGLMGAQAGQTGVELLPNLADPQHRALHDAIRWPISTSHLGVWRGGFESR